MNNPLVSVIIPTKELLKDACGVFGIYKKSELQEH